MSTPIAVIVTDANGNSLTITGSTSGTHFEGPTPVVLCDVNGNVLSLSGSVGGTWGSITGTLSDQTDLAAALALKATIASPTFTGTVGGITKSMVGLGSVDNTSDAGKPVSTAQQTALDLKANLAGPALTGVPTAPTASASTNNTQLATTAYADAAVAASPGGWSAPSARRHATVGAGGGGIASTGGIANGSGEGDVFDGSALNTQYAAPSATAGPSSKWGSGSTATASGLHSHQNHWRTGKNIASRALLFLTRITDIRVWYGITDQSIATMSAGDNPAGNYAAFRFSATGGDSNWQAVCKDNTTQTVVDLGVAPVAGTSQVLAIVADDTGGTGYKFYINGVLKTTINTHLPTSGTNCAVVCSSQWVTTQTFHNITAIDTEADY